MQEKQISMVVLAGGASSRMGRDKSDLIIEGKTFFTFGGGYSIDKPFRKENVSWWPAEMPNTKEYENGLQHLSNRDHVDYIITHTAPDETVYFLSTIKQFHIKGDVYQEMPLTTYLNDIQKNTSMRTAIRGVT